jgi:hypothetical protein
MTCELFWPVVLVLLDSLYAHTVLKRSPSVQHLRRAPEALQVSTWSSSLGSSFLSCLRSKCTLAARMVPYTLINHTGIFLRRRSDDSFYLLLYARDSALSNFFTISCQSDGLTRIDVTSRALGDIGWINRVRSRRLHEFIEKINFRNKFNKYLFFGSEI